MILQPDPSLTAHRLDGPKRYWKRAEFQRVTHQELEDEGNA